MCCALGQVWKGFSVPAEILMPEIFKITSLLKDFQASCQHFLTQLLKLNGLLAFVLFISLNPLKWFNKLPFASKNLKKTSLF